MISEGEVFANAQGFQKKNIEDEFTKELLVLGYITYHKLDIAKSIIESNPKRTVSLATLQKRVDNLTEDQYKDFRKAAGDGLARYAEMHPPQLTPPAKSKMGEFWFGVGQGVVAAALWSLILVAAAVIVKVNGIDIIEALRPKKDG